MLRSLTAAMAFMVLGLSACASPGVEDELAGETSADDAVDGKADAAVDGAYTYFEVWTDLRKCASPVCGGFFLHRVNRSSTICHDGSSKFSCYTPEFDWSEANLSDTLQTALLEKAQADATSEGALALVRGRFAPQTYGTAGNMGRFVVTEAWVAEGEGVSDGVFTRVHSNHVQCIQAPCPTLTEKALNTSRAANIHGLDWTLGGFADDQITKMQSEITDRVSGVIIAGDRYTFTENGIKAKGRTVTAAYRRLEDAPVAP